MRTIVWFRGKELRVRDHAPLHEAVTRGDEMIPLFVLDPYFFSKERARELPHRMQFLLESLEALAKNISHLGSELVLVKGKAVDVIPKLATEWSADRVVCHRWVEPFGRERDRRIAEVIGDKLRLYEGETMTAPGSILTKDGRPFSVYTPFSRACLDSIGKSARRPLRAPSKLPPLPKGLRIPNRVDAVPTLEELGLSRNPRLQIGGEKCAHARLAKFLDGPSTTYETDRDRMDRDGTSRLSADLKFGTLSALTVYTKARELSSEKLPPAHRASLQKFVNELVWREFSHAVLWSRPHLLERPFREDWRGFPYVDDDAAWRAWIQGNTGYPVVDASARQLLAEGYVHNRARMISASFLTKHLMIDYRRGEGHYMKYLTDGDWAQNDAGWQWSAGCGCDAQPYFRVFNPMTQGERFDPEGDYVRRWVPELSRLPTKHVHAPWEAPREVLASAGIEIGKTYPGPIVDHKAARDRFLSVAKSHLARRSP